MRQFCVDCNSFTQGTDCGYCGSWVCRPCSGPHISDHLRHGDEPWDQGLKYDPQF